MNIRILFASVSTAFGGVLFLSGYSFASNEYCTSDGYSRVCIKKEGIRCYNDTTLGGDRNISCRAKGVQKTPTGIWEWDTSQESRYFSDANCYYLDKKQYVSTESATCLSAKYFGLLPSTGDVYKPKYGDGLRRLQEGLGVKSVPADSKNGTTSMDFLCQMYGCKKD